LTLLPPIGSGTLRGLPANDPRTWLGTMWTRMSSTLCALLLRTEESDSAGGSPLLTSGLPSCRLCRARCLAGGLHSVQSPTYARLAEFLGWPEVRHFSSSGSRGQGGIREMSKGNGRPMSCTRLKGEVSDFAGQRRCALRPAVDLHRMSQVH